MSGLLGLAACAPSSPEEKVAEIRSLYSARLNGFVVEEEPLLPEVELAAGEDAEVAVEAEPAAEEADSEGEMPVQIPVKQRVLLDILIQHDSYDKLPGITVDISMADSAGAEKNHWRVWFDTADINKANVTQFTHVLEDVSYQEGDGFFAEVRHPVPAEERGEYREFAAAP
jgi:hypothetical protein